MTDDKPRDKIDEEVVNKQISIEMVSLDDPISNGDLDNPSKSPSLLLLNHIKLLVEVRDKVNLLNSRRQYDPNNSESYF